MDLPNPGIEPGSPALQQILYQLKPDLNKGTLIYSQAEGQGPLNQAIMYDYNNKNNKKQVKETVSHMGKYMGFFYALMLF